MKYNIDTYFLYFGGIFELFIMTAFIYSQYRFFSNPIIRNDVNLINDVEALMCFKIAKQLIYLFYIIGFFYLVLIVKKLRNNLNINLKKNTLILFFILMFDWVLFLFDFQAMMIDSYAFRFVIICLLTNLVVYIKYKKNNIKIE